MESFLSTLSKDTELQPLDPLIYEDLTHTTTSIEDKEDVLAVDISKSLSQILSISFFIRRMKITFTALVCKTFCLIVGAHCLGM
jgi:hypothetical protein